ncbi:MAG: carboxymuconolactone decarboxylase family protein [Alphaproteobacteria bacterium]|nr:carboxymuconolactone decarboxylase family protein [Alphaproteobacteria bacterium]TAD92260.1 MAG: carboxymuconolactone decarboxylase family protein [Alphaproteobacteria bacterium]
MSTIRPVDPATATGKAKTLLDQVQSSFGVTPNMMKVMAHAPAALGGYLGLAGALGGGVLDRKLREQVALAVAGVNACTYCASAHTAIGAQMGLSPEEAKANLLGNSADPKVKAALVFARAVVAKRGRLDARDIEVVRAAGYSDAAIVELIAHVALNIFTNYFNLAVATEVDFPVVDLSKLAA